jgi:hypothetical protein
VTKPLGVSDSYQGKTANSREAAQEYSPRRKPWERRQKPPSPSGAKDQLRRQSYGEERLEFQPPPRERDKTGIGTKTSPQTRAIPPLPPDP